MLTAKQEAFAQNIVSGMNQADAYRSAYDADNMSDNAIYREASLLMSRPKVAQRISEMRNELAKPTIMSAQERLEWLTGLIKDDESDVNAKLKAVDIMNKMQGGYIQRIEADVNNDVYISVELTED